MIICFESTYNAAYVEKALSDHTDWTTFDGGYNQLHENALNPNSRLYSQSPDAVVLLPDERMFETAKLLESPFTTTRSMYESAFVSDVERIEGLVSNILERIPDTIVLFCIPAIYPSSLVGPLYGNSKDFPAVSPLETLNGLIAKKIGEIERAYVCNLDNLCRQHGWETMYDSRIKFLAKSPYSRNGIKLTANYIANHLKAIFFPPKKVIVCDVDNTLWGGVVGEDGPDGIVLGEDGPGKSYKDFQSDLKQLSSRGVLLAIASKNNEADVLEVFDNHPHQLLRQADFAAIKINWKDKAENIREIADELNLGHQSIIFFDDNPLECNWVRSALPEVTVVNLPQDSSSYRDCLRNLTALWTVNITAEDRKRTNSYQLERKRKQLEKSFASYDDYLMSLNITAMVYCVNQQHTQRVAQLINKTNQFNLTTRRFNQAQVVAMTKDPDRFKVLACRVKDVFDDYGIVGAAILERQQDVVTIEVILLSCRVLGRRLETAFLTEILKISIRWGATSIQGYYIPSNKNALVKDFYADHGFDFVERRESGEFVWSCRAQVLELPRHINMDTVDAKDRSILR